jgi:hypothetical protein
MADAAAAVAEPGYGRPFVLVCDEKLRCLFSFVNPNGNQGDEAVAAEPREHSRWILVCLLCAGGLFTFFAACWVASVGGLTGTVACILLLAPVCAWLSLLGGVAMTDWLTGFQAGEDRRIVDNLLQV